MSINYNFTFNSGYNLDIQSYTAYNKESRLSLSVFIFCSVAGRRDSFFIM